MNPFEENIKRIPNSVPKIISTEDLHCERCGRNYTLATFEDGGQTKVGCDCEMIELAKKQSNNFKQRVRREKANKVFKQSLINEKTKRATFDTYEPTTYNLAYAKKTAESYVEKFDLNNPRSIYFHGSFGTGKSHLAYSIAREVKEKGYTVLFMNVPQLMTLIKNTYNKHSDTSEYEIMKMIADVDLMIFDDIGVGVNDFALTKLFEIVDSRIGKNNIYTTNLTSQEFSKDKDWQRIFSRIIDDAHRLDMNGEDFRIKRGITNEK